jgi:hypothetical protein
MRHNERKEEEDRQDPGRAPMPPEHPAVRDADAEEGDDSPGTESSQNSFIRSSPH